MRALSLNILSIDSLQAELALCQATVKITYQSYVRLIMTTQRKTPLERKLQILDTARHILVSQGYHKLTMRNLANEVGIKLASLQYHYKSREDLLIALVEKTGESYEIRLQEFQQQLNQQGQPSTKLMGQMIDSLFADHKDPEENKIFSQLQALAMDEPKAEIMLAQLYKGVWQQLASMILSVNPSLSKTERNIRSAMVISMLEGSGVFISSETLYKELPASFEKRIKQWVIEFVSQ